MPEELKTTEVVEKTDFEKRQKAFEAEYLELMAKHKIGIAPLIVYKDLQKNDEQN